MKRTYEAPVLSVECFELNDKIATGCGTVVNLGPGNANYEPCEDYYPVIPDQFGVQWKPGDHMGPIQTNFYPDSCDCYLTAGTGLLFTS